MVITNMMNGDWHLNFGKYNASDDIVISEHVAKELLRMKENAEDPVGGTERCTINEHIITDDGNGCVCGYLTKTTSGSALLYRDGVVGPTGGLDVFKDGDKFCAVYRPTFKNIQESPAGFGITETEALLDLVASQAEFIQRDLSQKAGDK